MKPVPPLLEQLQGAAARFDSQAVKTLAEALASELDAQIITYPDGFCRALASSVERFDDPLTRTLCERFTAHLRTRNHRYDIPHFVKMLQTLRRKRHFGLMATLADEILQVAGDMPTVQRLYAQALIDQGLLDAAFDKLTRLAATCETTGNRTELAEVRGQLGRVFKQMYVNAHAAAAAITASTTPDTTARAPASTARSWNEYLIQAVGYYRAEFLDDMSRTWHGVNALALWHRAVRDGVALPDPANQDRIDKHLKGVLARATASTEAFGDDPWHQATMAEICLAAGDHAAALAWISRYVSPSADGQSPVDAFEIASTLRQFQELWQLQSSDPGEGPILEVLRAALLARQGGAVDLREVNAESHVLDDMLQQKSLERVLGRDRFKNLRWYQTGLQRARCVCKIIDRYDDGVGTGFVMPAELLGLSDSLGNVVVTNAHVVSPDAREQSNNPAALAPAVARVVFEASDTPDQVYEVAEVVASSPRDELDFAILSLREPITRPDTYPIAGGMPLLEHNQRIYVIGHPRGGGVSFSLNDNLLIDHESPRVHYRSPTEGGSSGSPIFNQDWELIGLHHAGGLRMRKLNGAPGHYPANEGLWIHSIRQAISNGRTHSR